MGKRTGIMLATMFTAKKFNATPKPLLVQPKIEGDRLRVVIKDYNIKMFTSHGNKRTSVPHIHDELQLIGWNNIELDGELYKHGMRHSEIRSIVSRTKNLHPDYKKMEYHIFDIINYSPQEERLKELRRLFREAYKSFCGNLHRVPTFLVSDIERLQSVYQKYLLQGYEGIIIRHPAAYYFRRKVSTLLKLKPRVSEYFEIVGIEEEKDIQGERKGVFGAFHLVTKDGTPFSVGTGPTNYQRVLLWEHKQHFIGRRIKIRFQGYTRVRNVPKLLSIDKEWLSDNTSALE